MTPPWGGPRWLARGAGRRLKKLSDRFLLDSVKLESNTSRRACPGLTKIDATVFEKIASTFERAFSRVGALAPRVARSGALAPGGGRLDTLSRHEPSIIVVERVRGAHVASSRSVFPWASGHPGPRRDMGRTRLVLASQAAPAAKVGNCTYREGTCRVSGQSAARFLRTGAAKSTRARARVPSL